MSLTQQQIKLVRDSFAKVEPIADAAAEIFYTALFELDPSLRKLFKADLRDQGKKLMSVLKIAVASLDKLDQLVPVLQQLATRHVKYGVQPKHYTLVGNALIHTLNKGLGAAFTTETRAAWVAVFALVAQVMRAHAYPDAMTNRGVGRQVSVG